MSDLTDAIARLTEAYYNSQPVSAENPGGLAADGHVTNFPASLKDIGEVVTAAQSWVAIMGGDALTEVVAFDAQKADKDGTDVIRAGGYYTGEIIVDDDSVGTLVPESKSGLIIAYIYSVGTPQIDYSVIGFYDAGGSPRIAEVFTGTNGHYAQAVPTGTTGPDDSLGVFVSDGQIDFEMRFGSARIVRYVLLG